MVMAEFNTFIHYMGLIQAVMLVIALVVLLIFLSSSYKSSYAVKAVAMTMWLLLATVVLTLVLGNIAQPLVLIFFTVGGVVSLIKYLRGNKKQTATSTGRRSSILNMFDDDDRKTSVIDIINNSILGHVVEDQESEGEDEDETGGLPLHLDTPQGTDEMPKDDSTVTRRLVRFKTKSFDEGTPSPTLSPSRKFVSMDIPQEEQETASPQRRGVLKWPSKSPKSLTSRHGNTTNAVFIWLVVLILLLVVWHNLWLLVPLGFIAGCFTIKHYLLQSSWLQVCHAPITDGLSLVKDWFRANYESIFPPPLPTLVHWGEVMDRKLLKLIKISVGSIVSALIILGLTLLTMGGAIVLILQIQVEITHTLHLGTHVLNSSITDSPWVKSMLQSNDAKGQFEQFASTGYQYGRTWLRGQIQSLLIDSSNKEATVDEIFKIYDNLYQLYVVENSTTPTSRSKVHTVTETTRDHLLHTAKEIVSDNIETILSVLKSVWSIVSANVSILITLMTSLISLVFSGGTILLNTFVFITTLFYLLAYSDDEYLPAKWITSMLPSAVSGSHGSNYGDTFYHVVQSVIIASIRRAVFYGLYTWFVLSLFSIDIIFLPSALAALTGAVPFIGSYWVGLPAILQLWLIEGSVFSALVTLGLLLLPPLTVDTLINREIKGGHPYLTGLAIVGGMYFSGLEGAVLGPILLCFMLFVINLLTRN